jgi:hypothetical protein
MGRFWDKTILVCAALLVCVIGGAAFWLADKYHMNPAWVFLAWNSIFLIPIVGRDFRSHWKRPPFIAFFGGWMVLHGVVMVLLTGWVPILYWAPFIVLELFLGYFFAYLLFGMPNQSEPSNK